MDNEMKSKTLDREKFQESENNLAKKVLDITQGKFRLGTVRSYPGQEHYVPTYVSAGVSEK